MVDQQRVVRPARRAGHAVQVEGPDSERGAVRTAGEPLARGRVVDRDRGERVVVAERVVTRNDRVARQEWKVREAVHTGVGGVRDVRVRDLVARGTHVEGAVGEYRANPAAAVRQSILYLRWARAFASAARATAARGKRPLRQPKKGGITIFDSTRLAIQNLAIALAAMERADELGLPTIDV